MRYLQLFTQIVNPIEPILTPAIIRDALTPSPEALRPYMTAIDKAEHAAHVTTVWAAIAHAAFTMRDARALHYFECAQATLRHCFEVPSPDTIRAYLVAASAASMAGEYRSKC